MSRPLPQDTPQIYRPRRILAAATGAAGLLWLAVLCLLLSFDPVPLKTVFSAFCFVCFFAVSVTYYARTLIVVDAQGLTYRGMLRTQHFTYEDIHQVDVLPGPVTVYAIRSRRGFVHFTSFFPHHRKLAHYLMEKAGLASARSEP